MKKTGGDPVETLKYLLPCKLLERQLRAVSPCAECHPCTAQLRNPELMVEIARADLEALGRMEGVIDGMADGLGLDESSGSLGASGDAGNLLWEDDMQRFDTTREGIARFRCAQLAQGTFSVAKW